MIDAKIKVDLKKTTKRKGRVKLKKKLKLTKSRDSRTTKLFETQCCSFQNFKSKYF